MAGTPNMSQQAVIDYVQRSLGHPVLCVELTEDHYRDAVEDGEIWLAAYIGQTRQHRIQMTGGISEWDVPNDCEIVVDMAWPDKMIGLDLVLNPSAFGDTNELPYSYYSSAIGGGFASGLYQFLQYNEITKRTLSADQDFWYDRERRKLITRPARGQGQAIIWYLSNVCDYDRMTPQQYRLLRRYSVARASYILGNIRSKFSSVPAAGGTVTLNGSELISNAQLEFSELQEEIRNLVPPPAFFTG